MNECTVSLFFSFYQLHHVSFVLFIACGIVGASTANANATAFVKILKEEHKMTAKECYNATYLLDPEQLKIWLNDKGLHGMEAAYRTATCRFKGT